MPKDAVYLREIMAALNRYKIAYSKKDANMLLAATDEGFFGFGSGPDEKVGNLEVLKRQLYRDFAQSDDLDIDFGPVAIGYDGNVAWSGGDCSHSGRREAATGGQDDGSASQTGQLLALRTYAFLGPG